MLIFHRVNDPTGNRVRAMVQHYTRFTLERDDPCLLSPCELELYVRKGRDDDLVAVGQMEDQGQNQDMERSYYAEGRRSLPLRGGRPEAAGK